MAVDEFQTAYQKCNTIFYIKNNNRVSKEKKAIYKAFTDLEKAIDQVRRTTLSKTLIDAGIGSSMANAVKQLYSSKMYSTIIQIISKQQTGIRQGASSPAYIFIIFINR